MTEEFKRRLTARDGQAFGKQGQLTFELYRGGTFVVDGKTGYALQKSEHYGDVALIRSTDPLPPTFQISVVVGDLDYDLSKIEGLPNDPQYPEGPRNENGCYLLAIVDENPSEPHTNIWWHQHRKVVMDVDNNVWGQGMPHPIFMVYFDRDNRLNAFDGQENRWTPEWRKAVQYEPSGWYRIELEKTRKKFIMTISQENGRVLARGEVDLKNIWQEDESRHDYLVVGDPHENYYQGAFKIKSISISK